jgi:hypothetical protein
MRASLHVSLKAFGILAVLVGAACNGGGKAPHQVGDEDFVSQSPGGGGRGGVAEDSGGGTSPTAGGQKGGTNATQPARGIEEADIYKVVGDTLFVLNAYRGLQIIDIADPAAPHLISRVRVQGRPVDLYVRGGTAYVAVSDYFYYGWVDDLASVSPWRGSQVWAVDVSQPANPVVLGSQAIEGDVDETRIVGDILYVASREWGYWDPSAKAVNQDLTFVASFDIHDPRAMTQVARVDFPSSGWETHANVTVDRITLSQSGWDGGGELTKFQVLDISDPGGAIGLGASFQVHGRVSDRWAMDWDGEKGLFRLVTQNGWGNNGASLEVWASPSVGQVNRLSRLELSIPEALTAARFDGDRAYMVTAHCIDPLWVIDTADATNPILRGSLTMPGALDFVEPRGDRLVALGHDADGCHAGMGGLNVSLFDVADAANPKMLKRVSFGDGYNWIGAQKDDFRKVFQVLDAQGLILVPFQSWDSGSWEYQGGTQLLDYSKDDLAKRGFAPHSGAISRAFPAKGKLFALSDRSLQILDATDRDNPTQIAEVDLARPVVTLAIKNGKAVELSGDWYRGDTELAVTDAQNPEDPNPIARVKVAAPYARMFRDGDTIWLLARDYGNGTGSNPNGTAWVQAVDISNPAAPKLRGKLDLAPDSVGYWGWGWWSWGYGDEAAMVGHTLAMHRSYWSYWEDCWGCNSQQKPDQVTILDLSNPDAPRLASTVDLGGSSWSWGLHASGNFAWITHFEWVPLTRGGQVRYYVDRIDLSNPSAPRLLPKVNVPGVFFAASPDGKRVYTQEVTWSSSWRTTTTWLEELELTGRGTARLTAVTGLNGYPGGAVVNGGHAYVQTWDWSGNANKTTLSSLKMDGLGLESSQNVSSQWAWLMKGAGGKLFLSAGWYDSGILIYDLANPAQPAFDTFVRTEGYVEDVVVDGHTAYLPSGYYGVPMVDLTAGVPGPAYRP